MPGYVEIRQKRAKALYNVDKEQMLRRPGDNPALQAMYEAELEGKPGSHKAHELLHTSYNRNRGISLDSIDLSAQNK